MLRPRTVSMDYVTWVQALPPGLTIYKRPLPGRAEEVDTDDITCVCCGAKWRLGTWLCLTC